MPGAFAESALAAIEFPAALEQVSEYAVTALGKARVRALTPGTDPDHIRQELELVSQLAARHDAGDDLEPPSFHDPQGPLGRLALDGSVLEGTELVLVRAMLGAARLAGSKLKRASRGAPRLGDLVAQPLPVQLEKELLRALGDDGRLVDTASRDLARIRRELVISRRDLVKALERILESLSARQKAPDAAVTLRGGRYVIPVRAGGKSRLPGIVHDESSSHATVFIEPSGTVEEGNRLRSLEAQEAREVQRVLRQLTELLRPHQESLGAALEMLVGFDSAYARARFALARGASQPSLSSEEAAGLVIVSGAHPLLFQGGASVVRFDLSLCPEERVVIISGPNTGGKTVLLKAVGLIVSLTQSGVIPPVGPGTTLPVFTALYADIGDRQSIRESLSTFSAHVAALRDVLDRADQSSLVLLDEVGTGTDPLEGAALAAAALRSLARRGTVSMASTHLGALKELAGAEPGVVNAALEFDAATFTPTFRFAKGMPGRSYGLAIARRLGLLESVMSEAEASVPADARKLDATLAAAESRGRELERQAADLEARHSEMQGLAGELERLRSKLESQESALAARAKALERAIKTAQRDALLAARAEVERALAAAREGREKEARRAVEDAVRQLARDGPEQGETKSREDLAEPAQLPASLEPGRRVRIRSLGLEGEIESIRGDDVAVMVRGRRVRVPARDLAGA